MKHKFKVTKVRMWKRWGVFDKSGNLLNVTAWQRLAKTFALPGESVVKRVYVSLHEKE